MKRWPLIAGVPIILGLVTYVVQLYYPTVRASFAARPMIVCPKAVDFGERERGEIAVKHFEVSNRGTSDLRIWKVRTSCNCTGLEQDDHGKLTRVNTLSIPPGISERFTMRLVVEGSAGQPSKTFVYFATNDELHPEMTISASVSKVKAGAITVPSRVVFGTLQQGEVAQRTLEVFDTAVPARQISEVSVRSPNFAEVSFAHASRTEITDEAPGHPLMGRKIGVVIVKAVTNQAGPLTNEVEISLTGEKRPPTVIDVTGRVAAPVEISPTVVVLPRASKSGPIYSAECECRSTSGRMFTLKSVKIPPGFSIRFDDIPSSNARLEIEWDPHQPTPPSPKSQWHTIELAAQLEGDVIPLEVKVICREP